MARKPKYDPNRKRQLNVRIPEDLFVVFSKLCLEEGISRQEGIIRYLRFLGAGVYDPRRLVDEGKSSNFKFSRRDVGGVPELTGTE